MTHFPLVAHSLDVGPLVAQIDAQPGLWGQFGARTATNTFKRSDDIWVRYNDIGKFPDSMKGFNDEHLPVWYPAWRLLPALRPIVFGLLSHLQGEVLGGVLITRVPPGGSIKRHADSGWHVDYYDKYYVCLRNPLEAPFSVLGDDGRVETLQPTPGDVHYFDNRRPHWVDNASETEERMTLIVCIHRENTR